jgi:signal transduction histidine kinase
MKKSNAAKKMLSMLIVFMMLLTAAFSIGMVKIYQQQDEASEQRNRIKIVALNEIDQLTRIEGVSPASDQIRALKNSIKEEDRSDYHEIATTFIILYVVCMLFIVMVFLYIYIIVLRPFKKMEQFADRIAMGDFSVDLKYQRKNMFGAFTWAFDHMKREIIKARSGEKEAIENNKTVIATLSHDIKTPIASIRAYAEGLEASMDSSLERKERYIRVIMNKCDEVTELTNDLFLHSLSDLNKLKVQEEEIHMEELLSQAIDELAGEHGNIRMEHEVVSGKVLGDKKRLVQVIENIVNNAHKYADGPVNIWTVNNIDEGLYEIHIKDHGPGINPKDMPFIFEKFYRGDNAKEQPGAGLGLYIAHYIMNQMKGEIKLMNQSDGLEAVLFMETIQ